MRPTISVVCATHHPAGLVRRALEAVAGIADEVVIAADERVRRSELRGYQDVADIVARFPYAGANRFRPWLRTLASGEWLLLLDGDETPGTHLLNTLREVVEDRSCAGYILPCRWVHPDGSSYLTAEPWGSDRHLRLVRNDDRLWFPGEKHTGAETTGPVRRLDASFYHLDLLVTDEQARRRKVHRYRNEAPMLLTPGGREANAAYYLPEDRHDAARAALPEADARLVRSIVEQVAGDRRPRRTLLMRRPPTADRAALDRVHPRFHDMSPYAAMTFIRSAPLEAPAGSLFDVDVLVCNVGTVDIPVAAPQLADLRLSYHWTDGGGTSLVHDGRRTPVPHRLPSGQEAPMTVLVQAPESEGRCRLAVDLVHEGHRWLRAESSVEINVSPSVTSLMQAAADPGGHVPIDVCWDLRRRLGRADGLADAAVSLEPASEVEHGSSGALDDVVASFDAGTVLAFGIGPRVLSALERCVTAGEGMLGVFVVVDTAARESWCREEVARRGLGEVVRTRRVHAAASDDAIGSPLAHDLDEVREALGTSHVQLVVVGGPSELERPLRDACVPFSRALVDSPTPVIMLDGLTDAALLAADAWSTAGGVAIHGVRLGAPALLQAYLSSG